MGARTGSHEGGSAGEAGLCFVHVACGCDMEGGPAAACLSRAVRRGAPGAGRGGLASTARAAASSWNSTYTLPRKAPLASCRSLTLRMLAAEGGRHRVQGAYAPLRLPTTRLNRDMEAPCSEAA